MKTELDKSEICDLLWSLEQDLENQDDKDVVERYSTLINKLRLLLLTGEQE